MVAANLNDSVAWKMTTAGDASLSGFEAGYWLFLTDTAGAPDGKSTDAFTSPVYAVIDGTSSTTVTPKKGVPTVEKKILDDADATAADVKSSDKWKDVADSQIGQEVNYRLTGTIASNYDTFATYAYKFTDVLSSGLDYVDGSVKVYALNSGAYTEIDMSKYVVAWTGNTLTVEFKVGDGHKGLKDVEGVNANTEIVVFYKAKLNGNATVGNADGDNRAATPIPSSLRAPTTRMPRAWARRPRIPSPTLRSSSTSTRLTRAPRRALQAPYSRFNLPIRTQKASTSLR
jgi:fimbrial isopeptide formation D2 family protein